MKQYLPKKPIKRGFKVWVRAESSTGYFSDFEVYTGKSTDAPSANESELGLGEKVVLKLASSLSHQHYYHLFFDNYFSTCKLAQILLSQNMYCCGTARADRRDFPKALRGLYLQRGEHEYRQNGNVVATVWHDKRDVTMISSMNSPDATTTVERRQQDGTRIEVTCPEAVATYNAHMAGVDRGDQLRNYYRVRLKITKNYKYVFWFVFDVSVTNAFILSRYRVTTTSSHTLKMFRLDLATSLIGDYNTRKRIGRPKTRMHCFPSPLSSEPSPTQSPRAQLHLPTRSHSQRCTYCQNHRQPTRRRHSIWVCAECLNQPALCLTGRNDGSDCFRIWHSHQL